MEPKTHRQIQIVQPRDLGPREWGREILIVQSPHFIGKRLEMRAGTAGGLQKHIHKEEAFLLVSGSAVADSDDGEGGLMSTVLYPGEMVYVPPLTTHRVRAVTDCVFYEWSTPHFNDRVRVEKDYGEPEVGGLPTSLPDATGHS